VDTYGHLANEDLRRAPLELLPAPTDKALPPRHVPEMCRARP
jgi:hypothetical protein